MFDIGWSELVVIAVVALIAIGPKELPGVLRTVGQYMAKVRRMASEFQGQFQEALREAEVDDLKKQVNEMTDAAKGFTDFDPLASVRKEVDSFTTDSLGEATKTEPLTASGSTGSLLDNNSASVDTAWSPAAQTETKAGDAPAPDARSVEPVAPTEEAHKRPTGGSA